MLQIKTGFMVCDDDDVQDNFVPCWSFLIDFSCVSITALYMILIFIVLIVKSVTMMVASGK